MSEKISEFVKSIKNFTWEKIFESEKKIGIKNLIVRKYLNFKKNL